jgi:hypothetical protein
MKLEQSIICIDDGLPWRVRPINDFAYLLGVSQLNFSVTMLVINFKTFTAIIVGFLNTLHSSF